MQNLRAAVLLAVAKGEMFVRESTNVHGRVKPRQHAARATSRVSRVWQVGKQKEVRSQTHEEAVRYVLLRFSLQDTPEAGRDPFDLAICSKCPRLHNFWRKLAFLYSSHVNTQQILGHKSSTSQGLQGVQHMRFERCGNVPAPQMLPNSRA